MFALFARRSALGLRSLSAPNLVRNELLLSSSRLFHTTTPVAHFHENDKMSDANSAMQTLILHSHAVDELSALAPLFEQGGFDPDIRLSNYALTLSERRQKHMVAAILSTNYQMDTDFVDQVNAIVDTLANPLSDNNITSLHNESFRQIKERYHRQMDQLPLTKYLSNANAVAGSLLSTREMREAISMLMANQLTQVIVDKLLYESIAVQMDKFEAKGLLSRLPTTVDSNITVGIVGGVGSGKSTVTGIIISDFLKGITGNGIEAGAFISSDVFKLLLYADSPELRSHNGGTLTHEESKSMFNLALSVRYSYSSRKKPTATIIDRICFVNSDLTMVEKDKNTSLLMLGTNRGNLENVLEGVKKRGQSNAKDPRITPTKVLLASYKRVAESFVSIANHKSMHSNSTVFKLYDTEEAIKAKFSSLPGSPIPSPSSSLFAELSIRDKTLSIFNLEQMIDFIKHKHINVHAKSRVELYVDAEKTTISNLMNELLMALPGYRITFYPNAESHEKLAIYEENVLNVLDGEKYNTMKGESPLHFDALESVACVVNTASLSM